MNKIFNNLPIKFLSNAHSKYQNNICVGSVDDCYRGIMITEHPSYPLKFIVRIFILDDAQSSWTNLQMTPKQMELIKDNDSEIVLKGFGYDNMGNAFEDYGITLSITDMNINKAILHLFDRDVEMHYLTTKQDLPKTAIKKITFQNYRQGEGPGKCSDELWKSWLDLDDGQFEESETEYKLKSKQGEIFRAVKGEVIASPSYNQFYSHEKTIFDLSEGSSPLGGIFVIGKFKDANRSKEFILTSPFGLAGGSSILFEIS